jgi:hypothetical protein
MRISLETGCAVVLATIVLFLAAGMLAIVGLALGL